MPDASIEYDLRHTVTHLIAYGAWQEMEEALTSIWFLEASARHNLIFDLIRQFSIARRSLPRSRPLRDALALIEQALRRDLHFIQRHPASLFQCLWNRCWWHERPHPVGNDLSVRDHGAQASARRFKVPKVRRIVERWLELKKRRTPRFVWLRSLTPPAEPLDGPLEMTLTGPSEAVITLAVSDDGSRIAAASCDRTIWLWDASTGEPLRRVPVTEGMPRSIGFSTEGAALAAGFEGGTLLLTDVDSGQTRRVTADRRAAVECVALSSDGRMVATGSRDGTVRVWDFQTGKRVAGPFHHRSAIHQVRFALNNRRLVAVSLDEGVRVWNVANGRLTRRIDRSICSGVVAVAPDGRTLASGGLGDWTVLDINSGAEVQRVTGSQPLSITAIALSKRADTLVTGSWDSVVCVWNVHSGQLLRQFRGHTRRVECVAFSEANSMVASASEDLTVRLWDMKAPSERSRLEGHQEQITCLTETADRRVVVTGSRDSEIRIWNCKDGIPVARLKAHRDSVAGIELLPDGRHLVSWSDDRSLILWDLKTTQPKVCVQIPRAVVAHAALSDDGKLLAASTSDNAVRIWRLGDGTEIAVFKGHEFTVAGVAVAPNGRSVASASTDGTLRIWDMASKRETCRIREKGGVAGGASAVTFLRDPNRVAFAWGDGTLRVWNLVRGTQTACLPIPGGEVVRLHSANKGTRLITVTHDARTSVWDATRLRCLGQYRGRCLSETELAAYSTGFRGQPLRMVPTSLDSAVVMMPEEIAVAWCPFLSAAVVGGGERVLGLDGRVLALFAMEGNRRNAPVENVPTVEGNEESRVTPRAPSRLTFTRLRK